MNVADTPRPIRREDYDEAIARYAKMVEGRAIAVYRVGNVRYPGLSDLDLLVVTDRAAFDNRYFFSALQRMPRRLLPVFLHEPFILPAWCMEVLRHTTHYAPALVTGNDVIREFRPNDDSSERWCRMLESYCSYSTFAARVRKGDTVFGRLTVAVASAFRYLLGDAAHLFSGIDTQAYAQEMDALRAGFFDNRDPADAVRRAWTIFSEHFDRYDLMLREHLRASSAEEGLASARALLRGETPAELFDSEYATRRALTIRKYYDGLQTLGFPYGSLFFIAAHPDGVRTLPQTPAATLIRNLYRVRRRLSEYARA
jgi:hypothetical protein